MQSSPAAAGALAAREPGRIKRCRYRRPLHTLAYVTLGPENGGILRDVSDQGASLHTVLPLEVGQPIHICTLSQNFTDRVAQVEFLAGSTVLGVVTNGPFPGQGWHLGELHEQHTCFTWSNALPGAYVLTAQATDLAGTTVTSPPVHISVVTNLPPLVRISHQEPDAVILGPTNITVCASAFAFGLCTTRSR